MKDETRLVHAGRNPQRDGGIVNPPVSRASTVLYPTLDAFAKRSDGDAKYRAVRYGAYGVANTFPWPTRWRNWKAASVRWSRPPACPLSPSPSPRWWGKGITSL